MDVRYQQVSKAFGAFQALAPLDLHVPDGSFLAFLGPSGCGKTTALRLLAGLERPSGGRIYIGERDVTFAATKDRDIAMVFQNYALYPHMNVYENMSFGLKLKRTPRAEIDQRVKQAAQILDITELLDRKPKQL